jgi:hypothetical protein
VIVCSKGEDFQEIEAYWKRRIFFRDQYHVRPRLRRDRAQPAYDVRQQQR